MGYNGNSMCAARASKPVRRIQGFRLIGALKSPFPDDPDWRQDRSIQNRYRLFWILAAMMGIMAGLYVQYLLNPPALAPWVIQAFRLIALVLAGLAVLLALPTLRLYRHWSVRVREAYVLACTATILAGGALITWLDSQANGDISAWIMVTIVPPLLLRLPLRAWLGMVGATMAVLVTAVQLAPPVPGAPFEFTMFLIAPAIGSIFSRIFETSYKEAWHYRTLLEHKNAELQDISLRDGLTGIFNRRAFNEYLDHALAGGRRSKAEQVLVMIDIDRFKQVNDTWGHPAGDAVLCAVARCIGESIRTSDLMARYGGEEFAVILANTPLMDSVVVAERIRRHVEASPMPGGVGTVTVSAGLAGSSQAGDPAGLVKLADQALYAAKSAGRNCYVVNTSPPQGPAV